MSEIEAVLDQVDSLIRNVKPNEAEDRLRSLLATIGPAELRVWDPDLRQTINLFLPKRRRALTQLLDELTSRDVDHNSPAPASVPKPAVAGPDPKALVVVGLEELLDELSQKHIFQWATFYRDGLGGFFSEILACTGSPDMDLALEGTRELFRGHAFEIFSKGYSYTRRAVSEPYSIAKSVSGLQRFLDLPLEFYSAHLTSDTTVAQGTMLRSLTSSMLAGILEGYTRLGLGDTDGKAVLATNPRAWIHVLAFLNEEHLRRVLDAIGTGDFVEMVQGAAVPLAAALDQLMHDAKDYLPLPVLCQFATSTSRLEVSLQPPSFAPERELVEIQCYLDPDAVTTSMLLEAANRRIGAVIGILRTDVRADVAQGETLRDLVVPVMEDAEATKERLVSVLESGIYRRHSPRQGARPLEYNFAREFPLNNPFLTRYYFVVRTSVRDLLRTFERRNGVRLWCSLRRSGKTTAGLDLGTTTGDSALINQTCDSTGQSSNDSRLYDDVCAAIADGQQLDAGFLRRTLGKCAEGQQALDQRTVLVLDEYETLFGQLRTAAARDERLRYTVVQPLLNQFVAFAQDNLLVFLGQQPTAHFILMDQNQLSPYVQQDPFPLFHHRADRGDEFEELIHRF